MRVKALATRILRQIRHDKRTLALMLAAPLLLLTLVYFILSAPEVSLRIAAVSVPEGYAESLYDYDIDVVRCDEQEARRLLEEGQVTASVTFQNNHLQILLDGGNAAKAKTILSYLEAAKAGSHTIRPELLSDVEYVYGYEDLSTFDNFGSALIGILIFFLVFLVAGISFLEERTQGTLEKLLSTPIRRWEIVLGYTLGFGLITVLQSVIVAVYVIYVLDVMMIGSFVLVLLTTLLAAMSALTMGIMISSLANNDFQMMQFIPIIIVPQIFLSGLFELGPFWSSVGKCTPVYYVADALDCVMIRGEGLTTIWPDLLALIGFSTLFIIINILILKKQRDI